MCMPYGSYNLVFKNTYLCVCLHIYSQILQVRIINVEEYEKQENFFIVLEDPKWLKRGLSGECVRCFNGVVTVSMATIMYRCVKQ